MMDSHPELSIPFRRFEEEEALIDELRAKFDGLVESQVDPTEAFYFAWCQLHRNEKGFATAIGAARFYEKFTDMIVTMIEKLEDIPEKMFWPFVRRVESHNTVLNCVDPIKLLKLATYVITGNGSKNAKKLTKRMRLEARRNFAIVSQLITIEIVDLNAKVAEDLGSIDELIVERLFVPDEELDIWLVCALNPKDYNRVLGEPVITLSETEAIEAHEKIVARGLPVHMDLHVCRVAKMRNLRLGVYVTPSWKRPIASLLKLERGRDLGDRRGWKMVVIGVVEEDGALRNATRDDAREFHEHTRNVLWKAPLFEAPDDTPRNPNRHKRYWDIKVMGQFHRQEPKRTVALRAEQLVTTGTDYASTICSLDEDNHFIYRAEQMRETLAKKWYGHYGIDWDADVTKITLMRWWRRHLDPVI